MTDTTLDKVTALVADAADKLAADIKPDMKLIDDLGLGELNRLELICALEDDFSIQIREDQAETLKTVEDIVRYVKTFISGT
ncbi:phosphopantetheine-binding protein [Luteibacter sp. RCC_6_2]|uniref:phosphopantetheine-binding protein n=1 Tax=Luteibacter sp. RCC_6_2 TaxID=3239223 RepID=UPI003524194C